MELLSKYLVQILGAALLFGAGYATSQHFTYPSAYEKGARSRDKEVSDLKQQVTLRDEKANQDAEDFNHKIEQLQQDSQAKAEQVRQIEEQLKVKQQTVITKYVQHNPTSANACGLDLPTVKAINETLKGN